jgi:hypothetical protein
MADNWWEAAEVVQTQPRIDQKTFESARATLEDVRKIRPRVGFWTSGMLGAMQAGNPDATGMMANKEGLKGTWGYDVASDIKTLQGRNVINELGALKAGSPTGASGFGSLSGSEGTLLKSTIGNLDIGQSQGQLRGNLDRAEQLTKRMFPGVSPENPFDLSSGESRSTIPKGGYYRDPEGNLRRNDNGDAGNPIIKPAKATNALTGKSKQRPSLNDIFGN